MGQEIHRKDQDDGRGNTGENAATRKADPEWSRHQHHDKTSPGQRQPILEMGLERGEQGARKIGVKLQVLAQFGDTEILGSNVGAGQTIGRLTPARHGQGRLYFFMGDIALRIIRNDLHRLQIPTPRFGAIKRARGKIVRHNIVLRVLLQNLDIFESIVTAPETLNEPGAVIGAVTKNLALNLGFPAHALTREKILSGQIGVRRQPIIKGRAAPGCEQADDHERQQNPRHADPGCEHGDNFIGARHPAQTEKQAEQQRDRQKNDEDLRNLGQIILRHPDNSQVLIDKRRDVVTDVKNQPDGDKADDAIDVSLQKIPKDVAIEESHGNFGISDYGLRIRVALPRPDFSYSKLNYRDAGLPVLTK